MSRIAINAKLNPDRAGGVETNLLSMLQVVGEGQDDIDFTVLSPPLHVDQYRSRVPSMDVVSWQDGHNPIFAAPVRGLPIRRLLGSRAHYFDAAVKAYRRVRYGTIRRLGREEIDGILTGRGVGAVHFPTPEWFETSLPCLYEPWDLVHRHFPDFFTEHELLHRERMYRQGCDRATLILTATRWVKDDIIRQYQIPPEKIVVLRRSSLTAHVELNDAQVQELLNANAVPEDFIFFPAMAFEHKNHVRLLKALAHLRDESGIRVNLVLSGREYLPHGPAVAATIRELGLTSQVLVLGEISDQLLTALYMRARLMVFPSLFEGLGLPLLEAFRHRLPVVAARATSIPEVVGDAALLFDGTDVENMAKVLAEALRHPEKMRSFADAGSERLALFSWPRGRSLLLACYKRVLSESLTDAEEAELAAATG